MDSKVNASKPDYRAYETYITGDLCPCCDHQLRGIVTREPISQTVNAMKLVCQNQECDQYGQLFDGAE